MQKFLMKLVKVDDNGVVMRHRLNGERAYLISPHHQESDVTEALAIRSALATLILFAASFGVYVLLSQIIMGDYPVYRENPGTTIYAPAAICAAVLTFMMMRYANLMWRSPLALSVPYDVQGQVDREDAQLLFLAHANGELDSALDSLRRSIRESERNGGSETFEGPSNES